MIVIAKFSANVIVFGIVPCCMSVSGLAIDIDGQSARPVVAPYASVAETTPSTFRPHMSRWCFRESRTLAFDRWDVGYSPRNSLIGESCSGIWGSCHGGGAFGYYCRRP